MEKSIYEVKQIDSKLDNNIVVIGSMGTGKSTIINMLYNDDFSAESCSSPAIVGNTADSVTKDVSLHFNYERRMILMDTIGFGDPNLSEINIVGRIKNLLKYSGLGVKAVIFVCRFMRVSCEERMNLAAMEKLFDRRWKDQSILVLTFYEGDDEQKDLEKWKGNDPMISNFLSQFSKIILTNNGTTKKYEAINRPYRQKCLKEMKESIQGFNGTFGPAPYGLLEIIAYILEVYFKIVRIAVKPVRDLINLSKMLNVPFSAGYCSICQGLISLEEFSQTHCKHNFHFKCIDTHARNDNRCPICRNIIKTIYK